MNHEGLLSDYERRRPELAASGQQLEARLSALLASHGLKVHSVVHRLKDPASLRYKLQRPEKTYAELWDVTDLLGLRITAYFEDTIEAIARLLERELDVDFSHSTDRLSIQEHGRFGYRSLHYVCRLPEIGPGARFEIQIRSVLQHAWAEIEHDLGYKAQDTVPSAIRHRFSRLASLLELADEEFVSIRRALTQYQASVQELAQNPARSLPLDRLSLEGLVDRPEVAAADRAIATSIGKPLDEQPFYPEYLLKMLTLAGLTDTRAVIGFLEASKVKVLALVEPYFAFASSTLQLHSAQLPAIHRGYSLFFLAHLAILQSDALELNKVERVARFYRDLDYPNDPRAAQTVASRLLEELRRAGY